MSTARMRLIAAGSRGALVVCLGFLLSGCATQSLNSARSDFYAGRLTEAEERLETSRIPKRDRVLFLMERGAVRQAMGDYEGSTQDFIEAYDILVELETYSLSRGAGSLVINDQIKDFVGAPFERTLLHALTAQNHLAQGQWDNAAVEARRIIQSLAEEQRKDYPDVAYSRYIAGLALELIDDPSNATLQYRIANDLTSRVDIDPDTGRLKHAAPQTPKENEEDTAQQAWPDPPPEPARTHADQWSDELIVFLQLGRSPRGSSTIGSSLYHTAPLYAEIHADGKYLGRSFLLSDTAQLKAETDRIRALRDAAKTVGRIVLKEGIAIAVESKNNAMAGDLTRLILIGLLEQPDDRRWETLPRWMQVARVPAPPDLTSYTVVLKGASGNTIRSYEVNRPPQRRRNLMVSFFRDTPVAHSVDVQ